MTDSKKEKPIVKSINYHVWNKDLTQLAFAPNSDNVYIWETPGRESSKWKQAQVLSEHGGYVSCIDWSPVTNQIVTCGHDRNAYVWAYHAQDKEWRPTLVILRINRAATSVKWSPQGNKFAVTSGAKCVPVCHYEEAQHWWVSKMISKHHKSTVLTVAWSPNNKFVVTGATDYTCKIFSAYIENVDKSEDDGFGTIWKDQHKFGAQLAEYDHTKAWVSAVAWSPNGNRIAFAGHGSSIHFVQVNGGSVQTINEKTLPYLDVKFLDDTTLVAAGFDMNPAVYVDEGSEGSPKWKFKESLDKLEKKEQKKQSGFGQVRDQWRDTAQLGKDGGAGGDDEGPATRHENVITNICVIGKGEITTSGLDGRILYWKVK